MLAVLGQVLPEAVGIALSPIPIIGLILMLLSKNARKNSLMFMVKSLRATARRRPVCFGGSCCLASPCSFSPGANGVRGPKPDRPQRCPNGWQRSIPSSPRGRWC
jgi:hypothetical protein